ncbi:DUF368 domain-containing protein [Candidatus Avoscillospira sp. LCP25S3_F1]|uniref:DUF368 domain-containing protein n=1 Tax=Candidatus Avoscillospira sp. LCP25S3_F1 TaxID=3438825 RepID=UPI003F8FC833
MVQGILVGSGAILPGISGGVLCVLFGIYQPMMSFFAHPIGNFMRVFPQLFPAGIGWMIGFFAFAKLVNVLFAANAAVAIWLFIGLIAGSFPSLWREAGKRGHGRGGWTSLAVSAVVMLLFFNILERGTTFHIQPNLLWFTFCGVLWGLSVVVPGMSSSSTLIFLGLFEPMTAGIAAFDMGVVLPIFVGALATVVLLSRLVNYIFANYYRLAFHVVVGFVVASTVAIIPTKYGDPAVIAACAVCSIMGFAVAWTLEGRRKPRQEGTVG